MTIKRFDPSKMADRGVILVFGKRGTGKSVLCADLLGRLQPPFERGALVCETIGGLQDLECPRMFAPDRVHGKYGPSILPDVIAEQKRIIKEANNKSRAAGELARRENWAVTHRCQVLLDDVLYCNERVTDAVREVMVNGRQLGINMLITMQYPMRLAPNLRCNVDYVFIFRETVVWCRRRLYEYYAGILPTFEAFECILDRIMTTPFECLVIDNTVHCVKPEDCLFFYKAEMPPSQQDPIGAGFVASEKVPGRKRQRVGDR
jgi:hypothetical protein